MQGNGKKYRCGFSLLEILIVVIIVGALMCLAFSNFGILVEKIHAKEGDQILYALYAAQKRYATENNNIYASSITQLDVTFPAIAYFGTPVQAVGPQPRYAITRNGSYTLTISSNGIITCSGGPANLCTQMGYSLTTGGPPTSPG